LTGNRHFIFTHGNRGFAPGNVVHHGNDFRMGIHQLFGHGPYHLDGLSGRNQVDQPLVPGHGMPQHEKPPETDMAPQPIGRLSRSTHPLSDFFQNAIAKGRLQQASAGIEHLVKSAGHVQP
jgi:hypothetical protein